MASKFLVHETLILEMRMAGKSWREAAATIQAQGTSCDHAELFRWFQARRRRQAKIARELKPFLNFPKDLPAATAADPIRTAQEAAAVLAARKAGERKQPTEPGQVKSGEVVGEETAAETRERVLRQISEKKARKAVEEAEEESARKPSLTLEEITELQRKKLQE